MLDSVRFMSAFAIFYMLLLNYAYMHEAVHVEIYRHDGCDDVYMNIDYTMGLMDGSYVMCRDAGYRMGKEAYILNMQNEIVSYNMLALIFVIVGCAIFSRMG